jgi:hypothetical protein
LVNLREWWKGGIASFIAGSISSIDVGPLVEPLIGYLSLNGGANDFATFTAELGGISIAEPPINSVQTRTTTL